MKYKLIDCLGIDVDRVLKTGALLDSAETPVYTRTEDRIYVEFRRLGVSFTCTSDRVVTAIHVYGGGFEGFPRFRGSLPEGISLSNSQDEIRRILGTPELSGKADLIPVLGKMNPWDRYRRETYLLHFQFSSDCRNVEMLTLMVADWYPGMV